MTVAPDRSDEKKAAARHPLAPLTVAEAGAAARAALAVVWSGREGCGPLGEGRGRRLPVGPAANAVTVW